MRFATEDDFIDVYELFKKNRELLPHIRMGHIARKIEERRCIFTDGVVIIFEIHEKSVQVGKNTKSEKGRLVKNNRLVEPKGFFSVDQFEKPVLSVSISSVDKRNLYDAIRSDWKDISETTIEQIVEEKGFLVGVINKIIHGVVQVEDFEMYPIFEGENSPKVDFVGKMITDHPSIHCTLKERTVSGPTQGFNFKEE